MSILDMDYKGLSKIISGGQCGTDRGALEIARIWNIETGGTAPKGWRTHFGPTPDLATFGLVEHYCSSYSYRTKSNVVNSNASLFIAANMSSPGMTLTERLCHYHHKKFFTIKPSEVTEDTISKLVTFLIKHNVEILNVAGNRDLSGSLHNDTTQEVLDLTFRKLKSLGLLKHNSDYPTS